MLEFLFGFLQAYPPSVAVIIFAIIVLFVINIFYKVLIKQNEAKMIKQRSKDLNKELKQAQKDKDMDRQKKLMNEMLTENNKLMRLTMKPMLVSMIVVVIFLPSMSTIYGDRTTALVNGTGMVTLNDVNHTVNIVDGRPFIEGASPYELLAYKQPGCDSYCFIAEGGRYEARTEGDRIVVAPIAASMPFALPFIGWTVGWLGWYIIVSIPLMVILRKLMKIYV